MNNNEVQPSPQQTPKIIVLPQSLKMAVYFLLAYGVIVLVNACYYIYLSGDYSDFSKAVVRIFGVVIISYGLFKGLRWAFWLGAGLSAFIVAGFLLSIPFILNPNSIINSYPLTSKVLIMLAGLLATTALVFFIHPNSRKAFKK